MDNSDLTWLDLCSGLGGASQPALERGWKVLRVDNNPQVNPDWVCNLTDEQQRASLIFTLKFNLRALNRVVNVAWASSVCTDFTKWGLPDSWACNRGGKKQPNLALSLGCKAVIDAMNPDCWLFENVAASRPFLTPIFGPVRAMVDGHAIWGNFPGLLPQTRGHKWKMPPSPDRAALRAKIPYEIGEAICAAVERRRAGA